MQQVFAYQPGLLDQDLEALFKNTCRLAKSHFGSLGACLTFLDDRQQWHKLSVGFDVCQVRYRHSFCHYMVNANSCLRIDNIHEDSRFATHPLVVNPPYVQSFLGVPIFAQDGHGVACLNITDDKVRHFTDADLDFLKQLASLLHKEFKAGALATSKPGVAMEVQEPDYVDDEKFKHFYELSPIGIALNQMDGTFIESNKALLDLVGYSEDELHALTYWELTPIAYAEQEAVQLDSLLTSGRYGPYEKEYIHKDGHRIAVRLNGVLIYGQDGEPCIWSLIEDISLLKQTEAHIALMHQQLTAVHRLAQLGEWSANLRTGELYWSDIIYEIFGVDKQAFTPTIERFKGFVHPDDLGALEEAECRAQETGIHDVIHRIIRPDGEVRFVHERARLEADSYLLVGTVQDVTELRLAKNSLEIFKRVFSASQKGVGITDKHGNLLFTNEAHDRIHGYSPGELKGVHISQFFSKENAPWIFAKIQACIESGEPWTGLLPIQRKDGSELITAANVNFITNDKGELEYIFNLMSDYTPEQQRQNELQKAKEDAERASQAKSQFLASMSHELRTPMNSILGFAQLLSFDSSLNAEQLDSINEILSAGNHLLELINEVLDLAKIEAGGMELNIRRVSLQKITKECLTLIKPLALKSHIDLIYTDILEADLAVDPVRFKQIMLNLMSNAIKYNRPNGWVKLAIEQSSHHNQIVICVQDSGLGIPENQLSKLFVPFNRLGHEGSVIQGTGVGLSISKTLVELMHGELTVESELGVGSRFCVTFPLAVDH